MIVGIFIKVLFAAMVADIGEGSLAGRLLNSCEGETMEDYEETLVDVFSSWAEIKYVPFYSNMKCTKSSVFKI
jgi:hypothetical protein